jgi:hypothetical protein
MEPMREAWTDERLDDLSHRVDEGFREFREEMRALRSEMNTRFDRVEARLDSMQRTMILSSVGMTGAIVATLIGLIATQL